MYSQNIIEYMRKEIVTQLSNTGFGKCFPVWKDKIDELTPAKTEMQILNLGDHLSEIFNMTNTSDGRGQDQLSGGGAAWEALVCWYLNLCLVGRRTVVIKHNKRFMPSPVSDAITVNYNNFKSNTESDLIAITFPDKPDYTIDKYTIEVQDYNGNSVDTKLTRMKKYLDNFNLLPVLNALTYRDFKDIEIHIIQCKTNWNDNAQIPMLWDAVYAASSFNNGVSVGTNGFSIHDVSRFTYSFATIPSNRLELFKQNSTSVLRVKNLSGGNYWGHETKQGIASSMKEMLERNLKSGSSDSILNTIKETTLELNGKYSYFGI